jgi:hypothetical protein
MKKREVLFLNFSELIFDETVNNDISHTLGVPVTTIRKQIALNLKSNCYQQIVNVIDEVRDQLLEYEFVMVCPPALSIAAIYIVNEIYATTNILPLVLELEKSKNTVDYKIVYRLHRVRSLEKEKFFTKRKFEDKNERSLLL